MHTFWVNNQLLEFLFTQIEKKRKVYVVCNTGKRNLQTSSSHMAEILVELIEFTCHFIYLTMFYLVFHAPCQTLFPGNRR